MIPSVLAEAAEHANIPRRALNAALRYVAGATSPEAWAAMQQTLRRSDAPELRRPGMCPADGAGPEVMARATTESADVRPADIGTTSRRIRGNVPSRGRLPAVSGVFETDAEQRWAAGQR